MKTLFHLRQPHRHDRPRQSRQGQHENDDDEDGVVSQADLGLPAPSVILQTAPSDQNTDASAPE